MDGQYLELGEKGATETVVGTSASKDIYLPVMGPDSNGKIVKTLGVDVSAETRREAVERQCF